MSGTLVSETPLSHHLKAGRRRLRLLEKVSARSFYGGMTSRCRGCCTCWCCAALMLMPASSVSIPRRHAPCPAFMPS